MLKARRCQVRWSWVRIPMPAAFFTHEISVKVYLHHLALEAVRGACERCKCINLSRVISGSCT